MNSQTKALTGIYDVSILSLSTNDLIMGCSKSDFPTINDKSQTGKWNFIFWYWTVNRRNMKLAVTAKLGEALVWGVRRDDWESDEGWAATSKGLRRRGLTILYADVARQKGVKGPDENEWGIENHDLRDVDLVCRSWVKTSNTPLYTKVRTII